MCGATAKLACLVISSFLVSGCWSSKGSLYAEDKPLTPFKAGPVRSLDSQNKVTHDSLALKNGTYILGKGNSIQFRLFPLPGASSDYMVLDVALAACGHDECPPLPEGAQHYYGVAHVTSSGVEELMSGDCSSDMAKALGAAGSNSLAVCEFDNRAALEQALLTLIGSRPVAVLNSE